MQELGSSLRAESKAPPHRAPLRVDVTTRGDGPGACRLATSYRRRDMQLSRMLKGPATSCGEGGLDAGTPSQLGVICIRPGFEINPRFSGGAPTRACNFQAKERLAARTRASGLRRDGGTQPCSCCSCRLRRAAGQPRPGRHLLGQVSQPCVIPTQRQEVVVIYAQEMHGWQGGPVGVRDGVRHELLLAGGDIVHRDVDGQTLHQSTDLGLANVEAALHRCLQVGFWGGQRLARDLPVALEASGGGDGKRRVGSPAPCDLGDGFLAQLVGGLLQA